MSRCVVLTDYRLQKQLIAPILEGMGRSLPNEGCAVVFAEFNDQGEVIAFQILQNAIFFEGLWSKDKHSHLRTLWKMAAEWVRQRSGEGTQIFTMAAEEKVGRAALAMGCEEMPWKIYRKAV